MTHHARFSGHSRILVLFVDDCPPEATGVMISSFWWRLELA